MRQPMRYLHLLARTLVALAAAAPWLWLFLFVALAAAATLHLGRLPRYNNPDPKTIAHLAWLYGAANQMLIATLLSPLVAGAGLAVRSFVSSDIRDERWRLLAYAAGLGLAAIAIYGDVLRLGSWFLD
jgi:hypothetical protein